MDGSADEGSGGVRAVTGADAAKPTPAGIEVTQAEIENFIAAGRAKVAGSLAAMEVAADRAAP